MAARYKLFCTECEQIVEYGQEHAAWVNSVLGGSPGHAEYSSDLAMLVEFFKAHVGHSLLSSAEMPLSQWQASDGEAKDTRECPPWVAFLVVGAVLMAIGVLVVVLLRS